MVAMKPSRPCLDLDTWLHPDCLMGSEDERTVDEPGAPDIRDDGKVRPGVEGNLKRYLVVGASSIELVETFLADSKDRAGGGTSRSTRIGRRGGRLL